MNLAIIPARGGSKRIKDKNIIDFFGKPMIQYALEAARDARLFDKIHVSTESTKIQAIVEQAGFEIDFLRSPDLADDQTPLMPVLKWVIQKYAALQQKFDSVCLIQPCVPLIEADDLKAAYENYRKWTPRRPLISVASFPAPVEWAYRRSKEGELTPINPGAYKIRSQDLEQKFFSTGTYCIFPVDYILKERASLDSELVSNVLPRWKAVDINDPEDLEFAKTLYLAKQVGEKQSYVH